MRIARVQCMLNVRYHREPEQMNKKKEFFPLCKCGAYVLLLERRSNDAVTVDCLRSRGPQAGQSSGKPEVKNALWKWKQSR